MDIKTAVTKMKDNLKHGSLDTVCPGCGKTMRAEWRLGWRNVLVGTCKGDEVGWLKWANECGLVIDDLAVDTAQMDAILEKMAPKDDDDRRDRRIGRGALWPTEED